MHAHFRKRASIIKQQNVELVRSCLKCAVWNDNINGSLPCCISAHDQAVTFLVVSLYCKSDVTLHCTMIKAEWNCSERFIHKRHCVEYQITYLVSPTDAVAHYPQKWMFWRYRKTFPYKILVWPNRLTPAAKLKISWVLKPAAQFKYAWKYNHIWISTVV